MNKIKALILVALPSFSFGAIAFVQCSNNYPYTSGAALTTTAGNMLVVATSYGAGANRNDTVTDTHNTYVHAVNAFSAVNAVNTGVDMSYALNIAGGAETVALVNASGDDIGITVCEFSGVGTFDISSSTISGAVPTATPEIDAFTTAGTGLIVAYYANEATGSEVTAGSGYAIDANRSSAHYDGLEYDVDVPGGSQTPGFGVTINNNWMLGAMAFTTAGSGASYTGSVKTFSGTGAITPHTGTGSIVNR